MPDINPFYFRGGRTAAGLTELLAVCRDCFDDGIHHLLEGHFEPWLYYAGYPESAALAHRARCEPLPEAFRAGDPGRKRLDWFLESLCFDRRVSKSGVNYLLHLPLDTPGGALLPTIVFLHGVMERGSDSGQIVHSGLARVVARDPRFPFLVAAPQCPSQTYWRDHLARLDRLIAEMIETLPVDRTRIYLTGVSMGGNGVWNLAGNYPDWFAALAPICGGADPYLAPHLKKIPVWAFHGARDPLVPLWASQEMVEAVRKAGGKAQLTVYPDLEHDSWTRTYDNPDFYSWLLSNRRAGK